VKARRTSVRRFPAHDFLAEFEPELNQPHAIEELAHKDPALRRAYRALRKCSREMQSHVRNGRWARFSDARVLVQTLEFELAFNLGFEQGLLRGRAESLDGGVRRGQHTARGPRLDSRIRAALAASEVHPDQAIATLLRLAYALARGKPGRSRRRQGQQWRGNRQGGR